MEKLKKLEMMGEYTFPGDYKGKIEVIVNPEKKTLKFIDNGPPGKGNRLPCGVGRGPVRVGLGGSSKTKISSCITKDISI